MAKRTTRACNPHTASSAIRRRTACRPRCWSASSPMRRASIVARPVTTWQCRAIGTPSRCASSEPSPRSCSASRTVRGEDRGDGIDRVYWIAIYEILEARGFEVLLVNARDFHNVRGRKSDVSDCEWLQELHGVGLLRPSFRPAGEIVALRSYLRDRQTLVEEAAARIQRMHKALTQMNLQ